MLSGHLQPNPDPAITRFRCWNNHAGSDSVRDVFFNNLQVTSPGLVLSYTTNDSIVIAREAGLGDVDGDGLPDAWEQAHFGNSTGATVNADSDNDGALNWEEYVADTVPTNTASVWTNRIVQVSGTGEMQLWVPAPTTNSRVYEAWYTTNLMGDTWQALGFNQPGPANGAAFYFTVTNGGELRVYRTGVKVPYAGVGM